MWGHCRACGEPFQDAVIKELRLNVRAMGRPAIGVDGGNVCVVVTDIPSKACLCGANPTDEAEGCISFVGRRAASCVYGDGSLAWTEFPLTVADIKGMRETAIAKTTRGAA